MITRGDQKEIKTGFTRWLRAEIQHMIETGDSPFLDKPWEITRVVLVDSNTIQFWAKHVAGPDTDNTCFTVTIKGE